MSRMIVVADLRLASYYHRPRLGKRQSPTMGPMPDTNRSPLADRSPLGGRARARRRSLELPARRDAARRAAPLQRARRGAARPGAEHPDRPAAPPRTRRRRARRALLQAAPAHGVPPHRRRAPPGERAAAARRLGRSAVRQREASTSRCAMPPAGRSSRRAGTARPAASRSPTTRPRNDASSRASRPQPGRAIDDCRHPVANTSIDQAVNSRRRSTQIVVKSAVRRQGENHPESTLSLAWYRVPDAQRTVSCVSAAFMKHQEETRRRSGPPRT